MSFDYGDFEPRKYILNKIKELENDIASFQDKIKAYEREIFTKGLNNETVVQDKKGLRMYVEMMAALFDVKCRGITRWINEYIKGGFATEEEMAKNRELLEEVKKQYEKMFKEMMEE